MPFCAIAANIAMDAITDGSTYTRFDHANSYIGVGDGTAAFDDSHTDLQGTNKKRNQCDAGFPSVAGAVVSLQATYGNNDANFHWQEWAWFNAAAGGQMINRKVKDLGTKTSDATWQFSTTVTAGVA